MQIVVKNVYTQWMCFGRFAMLSTVWQKEFDKNYSIETLNADWNALKQKWSLSRVISDTRDSVTQITDEIKTPNGNDGAHCLEYRWVEPVTYRRSYPISDIAGNHFKNYPDDGPQCIVDQSWRHRAHAPWTHPSESLGCVKYCLRCREMWRHSTHAAQDGEAASRSNPNAIPGRSSRVSQSRDATRSIYTKISCNEFGVHLVWLMSLEEYAAA